LHPSEFRGFEGMPNIVGAMYDPGPVRLSMVPPGVKLGDLAEPMVRCNDGAIRRYPASGESLRTYKTQVQQGLIYDVPAKYVTRHIGGLKLSADGRSAGFEVNGVRVSPAMVGHHFTAYPLPNGRMLVPQPNFMDCTAACELMMLLDHGHLDLEAADAHGASRIMRRRENPEIMESLQDHSGRTPVEVVHHVSYKKGLLGTANPGPKRAWRDLGRKIDEMGPCILSKGSHVVMLDGVRESGGKIHLTIREPFHGSSLEFRDTGKFFDNDRGAREDVAIKAIFLKPAGE